MKWIKIISPLLVLFIVIGVNLLMKDYKENSKIKSFLAKGEWSECVKIGKPIVRKLIAALK